MDIVNFRAARLEDAPGIAYVHAVSWRATYPGIVPQSHLDSLDEREFAERWQGWLVGQANTSISIAEANGRICGFAAGGPIRKPGSSYDGELYAIYLLPTAQHQGTGRRLFFRVARELAARGMHGLLVWVLQQNPATKFYERLGGERVAEGVIEVGGACLTEVAYGWSDVAAMYRRSYDEERE